MDPLCIQSLIFTQWLCQCYLEACLWYSDFQQEHLKPNAKCFLLNYPNTDVWVMSWKFSPLPKEFSTLYPVMDIMLCLSLGRIYPWNMCLNTFSFSLFWLNLIDTFPFPLVYLNPYCDLWYSSNNSLLVQTPQCAILSARPCYYSWWHFGSHWWTRTLPIGPPHSTSRRMVLFVPRP